MRVDFLESLTIIVLCKHLNIKDAVNFVRSSKLRILVAGSHANGGNKANGLDHAFVDIDTEVDAKQLHRKPPLPILLKVIPNL